VTDAPHTHEPPPPDRALSAYLLGTLGFDALLALQRRLVYEVGGGGPAALVLCDHPPGLTVGREGSRAHVRPNPEDLHARGWPVRWVSRGGGVLLHAPGQVACYPILPLRALGLTPAAHVRRLQEVAGDLCREYAVPAEPDDDQPGVRVNGRRVAHLGVAVRGDVSCFGLVVNADPDLADFRDVKCDGDAAPMTSLARESQLRVRVTGVRQRLLELVAARFGFGRVSVFHTHPGAFPRPTRHAAAYRP
jgi:lipoyl(octanoyl) transferase